MISYKYPSQKYHEWFELLKEYIENKYVGIFVEVEPVKSGLLYESYKDFYGDSRKLKLYSSLFIKK